MASGLENIETIESPFRRFVTTIGIFPTAFTDAMTYYECLAYLVKYLEETVIPAVNENAEALEELQSLYIQLKSYVDNYFANLDVQEEINNKLDQMVEDGDLQEIIEYYFKDRFRKASEIGLSETSTEDVAINNFTLLKEALEDGFNILIDGKYPLKNTDETKSIKLTSDVTVEGQDDCYIYNFDDNYLYLVDETEADLNISKLTLKNDYAHEIYVIHNISTKDSETKYGNISVVDSTLTGNIRLMYFTNEDATRLNDSDWGLQNIDIINNSFENIAVGVCHITDTPHGVVNIKSNVIHNIKPVFFRASHFSEETDTNIEKLKCINADGNTVKNDDNFFTDSGTYGAFIVTKAYEVNVTNNKIEGIKSNNSGVAIYPCYLSGIFVNFKNNECINNINFASNQYNYLMKAKDGSGFKTFTDNTFTLDQTWLASINAGFATVYTQEELATNTTVGIYHNDHHSKRWLIERNIIKVGKIDNRNASKNIDDFIFRDNRITCTSFNGYLFRLYANVTNICDITGNEFYISDGSAITDAGIVISSNVATTADIKVNRNKFICNQKCLPIFGIEGSTNSIEALDNIYINNYASTPQSGKKTYNIKASSSALNISSKLTYANNQPTMQYMIGGNDVNVDTDIVTQGLGNADTTAEMIVFSSETTKSYVIELNYLKTDTKVSEYYVVKFTRSGSSNYITFVDNSDSTSKTVELANPASNTNYFVKDGEGGTSHLQLYLPASGDLRLRLAGALLTDNKFCNIKIHNI